MEYQEPPNIDGTVLRNRHNRQKRPTGHHLRAKCVQNVNQVAKGLIVWNQPDKFGLIASCCLVKAKLSQQAPAQIEVQYPCSKEGQYSDVVLFSDITIGNVRPVLRLLMAAAALLDCLRIQSCMSNSGPT